MSQKQINRYHVIMKTLDGEMTVSEAATALNLSERHITRLRNGVRKDGAAFFVHKNKGRSQKRVVTDDIKQKIIELYKSDKYTGANFLHFRELISEHENIHLSYTTVWKTLTQSGITSPKKRRRYKPHRSRKRKAQEGLLIQMDATPFEWFGCKTQFALHGGIDDATGNITGLYMTKNECLQGYFEITRQTIEQNGIPIGAYADRHAIFRSPKADKLTVEEQLNGKIVKDTQFGRAMKELGITLIPARSPQAKGRIERLWDTLQSRLVIEFRIHNIKTVHEANLFFIDYIPKFNKHFGVQPEESEKAYRPLTLDLDTVLCVKEKRVIDNGGVFSFYNKLLKITDSSVPNKAKIEVIASASKGIIAMYKGRLLDVVPYISQKKSNEPKSERKQYIPPEDHYYKKGKPNIPLYSSDLTDKDIHKMLVDIFLSKYA